MQLSCWPGGLLLIVMYVFLKVLSTYGLISSYHLHLKFSSKKFLNFSLLN
jgi:hypothetical protein